MRTDIDHLPPEKQRELEYVVQVLFEEFSAAQENAKGRRTRGRIAKIVLYGSHARGGFINEPHTAKGYVSDFDILVIVNQKELTDRAAHWTKADQRLIEEKLAGRLRTPVNFVVHSLQQVNDALAHGRFFFMDIARDGIALFEADEKPLAEPKPKTHLANLDMAREYFEEWFPAAMRKFKLARDAVEQEFSKEAAFIFHQTAESLYHCVLLVCTFYTPHNHNLAFLRAQAERIDIRIVDAWPRLNRKDRALFEKLKEAYVKARYSKHYTISTEELSWLSERVSDLGSIVHVVCSDRITALEATAKAA